MPFRQPPSRPRWALVFLAALVAALAAILVGNLSPASAAATAETRVRASAAVVDVLVEPPQSVSAGERLGEEPARVVVVVATGVAANAGPKVPAVVFSRSRAPGIANTFDNAVANGAPTRLNRVTGATRDANRRAALRGQPPAPAGQSLDEYPFACSAQGGCGSFVNPVPIAEQSYQGGVLSSFFQRYGIQPGDPFDVMFGP